MTSRGGVPACRGAGAKVSTRRSGGGMRQAHKWACAVCGRFVPINYDGSLRWHTPSPKRKDPS
jgi:hypothetical protein